MDMVTTAAMERFGLPDQAIGSDLIPWVPLGSQSWFKPLRFNLANGSWANLIRVVGDGSLSRHQHNGGQTLGYCLDGGWRYLEREWVAKPGTFIYEPPGDIHTLVIADGYTEMTTLFFVEGVIQYIDGDDQVIAQHDVYYRLRRYLEHCERQGIEPQNLCY